MRIPSAQSLILTFSDVNDNSISYSSGWLCSLVIILMTSVCVHCAVSVCCCRHEDILDSGMCPHMSREGRVLKRQGWYKMDLGVSQYVWNIVILRLTVLLNIYSCLLKPYALSRVSLQTERFSVMELYRFIQTCCVASRLRQGFICPWSCQRH